MEGEGKGKIQNQGTKNSGNARGGMAEKKKKIGEGAERQERLENARRRQVFIK